MFREDLSTIAIGDSDQDAEQDMHLEADADLVTNLEDYVGLWEYQGRTAGCASTMISHGNL